MSAKHRTNREARCPACQSLLTGATSVNADGNQQPPKPNDISVCVYCTVLLTFNSDLTVRLLHEDEVAAMPPEDQAHIDGIRFAAAIATLMRRKP